MPHQTRETLSFLPFSSIQGHTEQGTEAVQRPQPHTAGQQQAPPKAGVVSPSLRSSPWELQEPSTGLQRGQKGNKKAPLQIHEKAPGAAVSQARGTVQGSRGSGSVVHSVLTSPLMQGVGASQPQEQLQEHREGSQELLRSGFPWQLCSPGPPT